MNDWFSWNGVKCTEYGIHVTAQPSIICPSERVTYTNVLSSVINFTIFAAG